MKSIVVIPAYNEEKLRNENLDIVFGSRKIGKEMPLIMFLKNKFLSVIL